MNRRVAMLSAVTITMSIALGTAACVHATDSLETQMRSVSDSAAIIHALWQHVTSDRRRDVVLQLWTPPPGDTTDAVRLSDRVTNLLSRKGVPVTSLRAVGHDTVVHRIVSWQRDSIGDLISVVAHQTSLIGPANRYCVTSGFTAKVRVQTSQNGWLASWSGPVNVGEGYCKGQKS